MTDQKKPLTYLSLKCVLKYCKADLRILLTQHFPFIHRIEKSIPLKIEKLHLESFLVRINDTEYRLGTIRKFPISLTFGSFQCNLDEFGVPQKQNKYELIPGDVKLKHGEEQKVHLIEDQSLETLEFIRSQLTRRDMIRCEGPLLKRKSKFAIPELVDPSFCGIQLSNYVWLDDDRDNVKGAIERCREKNTSGNPKFIDLGPATSGIEGFDTNVDIYGPEKGPLINIAHRPLSRIQRISLIEQLQCHILPLQHRHYNIKPSFKCYLQLTTVSPRGIKIETVEYNQNMHVAMKYVNERIFGGRGVIHVEELEVGNGGVLTLPYSLKLKIGHLKMRKNWESVIDSFQSILEPSSFPLKSIESQCWKMYNLNHNNRDVCDAHKLIHPDFNSSLYWPYILLKWKNKHIHLKTGFRSAQEAMDFLNEFIDAKSRTTEIGAMFTAGVMDSQFSADLYSMLLQRTSTRPVRLLGVVLTPLFPHCFTIPLTEQTVLNIFGLDSTQKYDEDKTLWILNMKVMETNSIIEL